MFHEIRLGIFLHIEIRVICLHVTLAPMLNGRILTNRHYAHLPRHLHVHLPWHLPGHHSHLLHLLLQHLLLHHVLLHHLMMHHLLLRHLLLHHLWLHVIHWHLALILFFLHFLRVIAIGSRVLVRDRDFKRIFKLTI